MMKVNKTIVRGVILISYIMIIGLILFGISSIFTYLNTGADRSQILHTELKKEDYYLPKIEWLSIENEGRPMDKETLRRIESDYLDSWYVRQLAFRNNNLEGVFDYYTDHARENIKAYIDYNINANINVESTTLEHHLSIDFFSADGKLIVLTDSNVLEYKRIFKNNTCIDEINSTSNYHIIMLLEDGFWRIRHLKSVSSNINEWKSEDALKGSIVKNIKGVNYYPQLCPWDMYGDCFDKDVLITDFKIIKESGLNTVRIFVPYIDFGSAYVKSSKLNKLKIILDQLQDKNLKAIVTLFDLYGNYEVADWTLNQRHIESIVGSFKDHEAILAWDLKNEPDLDFKSRDQLKVLAWLKEMITYIKRIDKKHPVTIGWSSAEEATNLVKYVDFVSFHYYKSIDDFSQAYSTLQSQIGDKTIVLQEFGLSSYQGWWNPFGYTEEDQALYYESMQKMFKTNNVQFLSWTLYDFEHIPSSVVGVLPWRKHIQKNYGFIDLKGYKKPSYKFISKY